LRITWKKALIGVIAVGLFFTYFELPAPRYSEPTDYPSVVADELKKSIKVDQAFAHVNLRVMRAWGWRWGRYGASIQIWGVQNQRQQEVLLQHLKTIKLRIGSKRFVEVEFMGGLPDGPPFGHKISNTVI
jgi:hypothetical protein